MQKKYSVNPTSFGGTVRAGKRKVRRPFSERRAMHIVMRSSRARGAWSFLHERNRANVYALAVDLCERYHIRLHQFENVGNHIHLLVKFPSRKSMRAFLRVYAQRVMFAVTGARRGKPKGKFFEHIAFSRVVEWGEDFAGMLRYLWKNALESLGFSPDQVRRYRKIAQAVPIG